MKKLFSLISLCVVQQCVQAQVPTQDPYPNAVAAATPINKYSFFVDSVTNVNEQPLAFAAATNNTLAATPINLAGVTSGVHKLYAKVTAANGTTSITNVGSFYMEGDNFYANTAAAAVPINKYSFFVDSISNVNEQPLAFATANTNATASAPINLAGVTSGVHQLYAKVMATNGVPSIANLGVFYMDGDNFYANAPAVAVPVNRYEFFVDSVGNSNAQPLSFAAALQNTTTGKAIDLTGVLPGVHNLYARVFSANNIPGITNIGQFVIDQNFRYADVATPAPALQNMEYYIDTDPGYGLATPINISGTNTTEVLTNININIPTNLAGGPHFLHIRSKQNPWSIDNALPFNVDGVVPVTWLYVKAQLLGDATQVQWATANEFNSKSFDIEWNTDGVNFTKIGSVHAAGNTNNTSTYNFSHSTPANGFNYYRIKQIDVDGKFKYSTIVKVLQQQKKQLAIYPNPATSFVQLQFESNKNALVQIFDAQGNQVVMLNTRNQSILKVDIASLPKGNYLVQVSDGEVLQTGSFIKQ